MCLVFRGYLFGSALRETKRTAAILGSPIRDMRLKIGDLTRKVDFLLAQLAASFSNRPRSHKEDIPSMSP